MTLAQRAKGIHLRLFRWTQRVWNSKDFPQDSNRHPSFQGGYGIEIKGTCAMLASFFPVRLRIIPLYVVHPPSWEPLGVSRSLQNHRPVAMPRSLNVSMRRSAISCVCARRIDPSEMPASLPSSSISRPSFDPPLSKEFKNEVLCSIHDALCTWLGERFLDADGRDAVPYHRAVVRS